MVSKKSIILCKACFVFTPVDDDDEATSEDEDDDAHDVHDDAVHEEDIFQKSTCWGCQTNQPNQLAHMDPGGCLHFVASDDENSEMNEKYQLNTHG